VTPDGKKLRTGDDRSNPRAPIFLEHTPKRVLGGGVDRMMGQEMGNMSWLRREGGMKGKDASWLAAYLSHEVKYMAQVFVCMCSFVTLLMFIL
jgi:hypothetical protein